MQFFKFQMQAKARKGSRREISEFEMHEQIPIWKEREDLAVRIRVFLAEKCVALKSLRAI